MKRLVKINMNMLLKFGLYLKWKQLNLSGFIFTLFRIGGKKTPLQVFPPVTFTKVEIASKTFCLLVITLLPHRCKFSLSYIVLVPNYYTRQKIIFSGQILNFSYQNARVTKLWSQDYLYNTTWVALQNLVSDVMYRNYDDITFILNLSLF